MSTSWDRKEAQRAKLKRDRNRLASYRAVPEDERPEEWIRSDDGSSPLFRVVAVARKGFQLMTSDGMRSARVAPGLPRACLTDVAIGDWAFASEGSTGELFIEARTPRLGVVARMRGESRQVVTEEHVLAANVDVGVIVASIAQPAFYAHFIDRYLAVLEYGRVQPMICITKTDLGDVHHPVLAFYRSIGIPVIETSVRTGAGVDEVRDLIRGRTSVFLGRSGVGKSTLINAVTGVELAETGAVSDRTGEGMHTTTGSSLYVWDEDSYVIDTPGIRTIGTEHLEREQIRFLFPEFERFAPDCKYSSTCLHLNEPGCAVKAALADGDPGMNRFRYESYLTMVDEER